MKVPWELDTDVEITALSTMGPYAAGTIRMQLQLRPGQNGCSWIVDRPAGAAPGRGGTVATSQDPPEAVPLWPLKWHCGPAALEAIRAPGRKDKRRRPGGSLACVPLLHMRPLRLWILQLPAPAVHALSPIERTREVGPLSTDSNDVYDHRMYPTLHSL